MKDPYIQKNGTLKNKLGITEHTKKWYIKKQTRNNRV